MFRTREASKKVRLEKQVAAMVVQAAFGLGTPRELAANGADRVPCPESPMSSTQGSGYQDLSPHPHPSFSTECNVQPGRRTAVCKSAAKRLVACLNEPCSGRGAAAAPSGPGVLAVGRGREPGTAPPAGPAVRLVGRRQCQQQGHPSVSAGFPSRGAALLQIQALGGARRPMHVCCTGLYLRGSDFSNPCDGASTFWRV